MDQSLEDSFGNLPDEILCRIVSFLPSETALETSFLSTRWRGLWNLAIVQQTTADSLAAEVDKFVSSFEKLSPLARPRRLQLSFGKGGALLASIAANDKLKLDFSLGDHREIPCLDFGFQLKLNHQNGTNHLCPSNFFVKTLHLKSVASLTHEAVSSIISKFHSLESLKIVECNGLKSLHVESNPNFVSLAIYDCPELEYLHLKCSKLRSFRYRGKLPRIWPENHFNLADAMLDFRAGLGDDSLVSCDFDPLLLTIKNSEVVTLCKWAFETLIWPSVFPLKESFQFYKLKELWWIDDAEQGHNTDSLIYFLKLCPALERLFITIDPKSYGSQNTISTCSKKITKRIELGKLRVVKMEGFMDQEDEITLMKNIREIVTEEPLFISASESNSGNLLVESFSPKHAQTSA